MRMHMSAFKERIPNTKCTITRDYIQDLSMVSKLYEIGRVDLAVTILLKPHPVSSLLIMGVKA